MNLEVELYLQKLEAEKAAEEAVEVVSQEDVEGMAKFLRGSWIKLAGPSRMINRAGGNFWMPGRNRNRCSILRPAMLKALVASCVLKAVGSGYQVL